jgi:hypothetical protein
MKTLALASALILFPLVSSAQEHPTDSKWNGWLGCWELAVESARDGSTRPSPSRRTLPQSTAATRPQICVAPSGNGVTLTTLVANQAAVEQTIVADGADHPIADAECRGTQRAEWSSDGRKVYSRADLSCPSDKGNRRVSGFSILGANGTWTDIQAVDVSGQQTVRVRSYRRLSEVPPIGSRLTHAPPLTVDDVKDAAGKVSPRALEAALVETGSSFDLSGKDLIALQDAKVPGSVTDLMIALSYPSRFVVEHRRADAAPATPFSDDPFFVGWSFGYPMWWDYGFYSPLYGPYSPYFYSPFYSYLPWYNPPYYYGGGGFIIVGDGDGSGGGGGGGGGGGVQPSGRGRVVDGLGYTRVRPREAEPTPHGSPGSAASSSSGSSSSSGGGGGGSVSSQGFSSGGSGGGDGGGRTAQPR